MIDLRSHILHGVSCGPSSFEESLAMARTAVANGVKTIVATPVWKSDSSEPPLAFDECFRRIGALETALSGALTIKLGFAIQFHEDLANLIGRFGTTLSLGGNKHLLISLPSLKIPHSAETTWVNLKRIGFSVLLAHPECNPAIRRDVSRLSRWVDSGVSLQLDAASVTGMYGRDIKRFSVECLRRFSNNCVLASNTRPGGTTNSPLVRARSEVEVNLSPQQAGKSIYLLPSEILGNGSKWRPSYGDSNPLLNGSLNPLTGFNTSHRNQ